MHVSDIETALAERDTPMLRDAFVALIDFPHRARIEGAKSVDTLCTLLSRVARALQRDQAAMPPGSSAATAAVQGLAGEAATYAACAAVVLEHHYHWRGVYLQHAANTGGV